MPEGKQIENELLDAIRRASGHGNARWARPPKVMRGGYFATILRMRLADAPGGDSVLDWTYATYDDPLYDVAVTRLILWHLPLNALAVMRPAIAAAGRILARRFTARYESASGMTSDRDRRAWFTRLAVLHILTNVEDWRRGRDYGRSPRHPFHLLAAMPHRESQ